MRLIADRPVHTKVSGLAIARTIGPKIPFEHI
jgi:hypothetical protein